MWKLLSKKGCTLRPGLLDTQLNPTPPMHRKERSILHYNESAFLGLLAIRLANCFVNLTPGSMKMKSGLSLLAAISYIAGGLVFASAQSVMHELLGGVAWTIGTLFIVAAILADILATLKDLSLEQD